jgi:1-acyl-sn-glycerol-3-phosphate acyltransferase
MGLRLQLRAERLVARTLVLVVLRGSLTVVGRERIPRHGPCILVGNHIATCDPAINGAVVPRLDLHFMAKSEAFRRWFPRLVLRGFNAFPVVRGSADRTALRIALTLLGQGHLLAVYPEGTRSPDHSVRRPFPGAGFIARRSGVPIVPVATWGSEKVLPRGSTVPRHATVTLVYGEPFHLPETNPDGTRMTHQQSSDYMMSRVAALLPERFRGVYGKAGELHAYVRPAA